MAASAIGNQKTIQEIIDNTAKGTSGRKTGELGKDDFLNLLVTQLRYQDPLKPVDDKEFIGQMAQFSALEQMQNMNSILSSTKAYSLIGKRVIGNVEDAVTKNLTAVEGEVTSVRVDAGKTYVVVKGHDIEVDKITDITDGAAVQSNLSKFTNLIGYNIDGAVYDSETGDVVGVSGNVKSVETGVYEDYAVLDGVKVEISDIVTDVPQSDPKFKEKYMKDHSEPNNPFDNEISVYVVNRTTGKKVPVTATLKDYKISPDGTITATLDNVRVPVESVIRVKPNETESSTDILLKEILDYMKKNQAITGLGL